MTTDPRAYYCEVCDEPAWWRLTRRGDAVATWSCGVHLDEILERLQRHRYEGERTEIVVTQQTPIGESHTATSETRDGESVSD